MKLEDSQRTDHDLIIRIESKLDSLTGDVKSISDGVSMRIGALEARVNKLDNESVGVGGITELGKRLSIVEQTIHDTKVTANAYRVIGGIMGGFIFFVLSQLPNWIKIIQAMIK